MNSIITKSTKPNGSTIHTVMLDNKVVGTHTSARASYSFALVVRQRLDWQLKSETLALEYANKYLLENRERLVAIRSTGRPAVVRVSPGFCYEVSEIKAQNDVTDSAQSVARHAAALEAVRRQISEGRQNPAFVLAYSTKPRQLTPREAAVFEFIALARA